MKGRKLYAFSTKGYLNNSAQLSLLTDKLASVLLVQDSERFDHETKRRLAILAGLTLIGSAALVILGVLSCIQGSIVHGMLDITMAGILVVNIYDARKRENYLFNLNFVVSLISLFYVYLYVHGGHNETAFVWYFTYPLIACYLLGSRKGALAAGFMLLPVCLMILVRPAHQFFASYSLDFEIRFLFSYTVVCLFSYLIERASEENRNDTYRLNENLEKLVEERTKELVQENENHKVSKELLKENEERYRAIFEKSVNAIFVVDKLSGNYRDVNPAAENLTGKTKKELLTLKFQERGSEEICNYPLYTPDPASSAEENAVIYERPDKTTKIAKLNSVNLTGDLYMEIAQDITELRAAESKRLQLEERLHQAQKMEAIGNLAGGIAHDFNNILVAVLGFTELSFKDADKSTALYRNLQEIYGAGLRAKELVDQILAYARQSEAALVPIQVNKIINEVSKLLRSTIPTTIDIQTDINSKAYVMADDTQVHQIMMNLCTNAAYAMRNDGGVLGVELRDIILEKAIVCGGKKLERGDYIVLNISDTGSGIRPEIMSSIFEPYFTTKKLGEGTGMGLAMVKGIVETYGGGICVESGPSKTIFSVYLPSTTDEYTEQPTEGKELAAGSERILFVDDEQPIVNMASQLLESLGYSVISSTSSIEALDIFMQKSDEIDLVITDMTMPRMTGEDLAAQLTAIRPNIPILLCTGYSDKIFPETARKKGIREFFYKPFTKALLSEKIRFALDHPEELPSEQELLTS